MLWELEMQKRKRAWPDSFIQKPIKENEKTLDKETKAVYNIYII